MPLVKASLQSDIASALLKQLAQQSTNQNTLRITDDLADDWGRAYDSYASQAMCSGMSPVGGVASTVASALKDADYLDGWEAGIKSYWQTVIFVGGGFIPANPCNPSGIACKSPIRELLPNPAGTLPATPGSTLDQFADQLATILDTHTKNVTCLTTTTSAPPVIVPVAPIS